MKLLHATVMSIVFFSGVAFGQTKSPLIGKWQMDIAQSEFTSTSISSFIVEISKESPEMYAFHGHGTDKEGKPVDVKWSGPEDGGMHQTIENGKKTFNQSAKKDGDAILRHGEETDEGSFDARIAVSSDGKTMVDEITVKSKDGKVSKEKHVYHRIS